MTILFIWKKKKTDGEKNTTGRAGDSLTKNTLISADAAGASTRIKTRQDTFCNYMLYHSIWHSITLPVECLAGGGGRNVKSHSFMSPERSRGDKTSPERTSAAPQPAPTRHSVQLDYQPKGSANPSNILVLGRCAVYVISGREKNRN